MSGTLITPETVTRSLRTSGSSMPGTCLEVGPTNALAALELDDTSIRPGGYVSGPVQFQAADLALYFLVFGAIGKVELMALTSELSIRFLRPCLGRRVFARATLERAGKTTVVGTVRVWGEGGEESRPSATAQGTYTLPRSA